MADINDLQEKLAAQQIETMEGNEQKRIEGLKSLNEAAAALEQALVTVPSEFRLSHRNPFLSFRAARLQL